MSTTLPTVPSNDVNNVNEFTYLWERGRRGREGEGEREREREREIMHVCMCVYAL